MSMREIRADDIAQIFSLLEELASGKEVVFRGQTSPADTINTTLQRFSSTPHKQWDPRIDEMLSRFIALVRSTGHFRPEMAESRRARLEYGRHFGVPSPLIDFSRSPYIALFFAFDRLRRDNQHDVVAIYALDVRALGTAWAKQRGTDFDKELENFMRESEAFLEAGFPANVLKYLPYPASWNIRMNRQMGVFIYDTLDYAKLGCFDFEGFVKRMEEPPDPSTGNRSPILTKVYVPTSCAGGVFKRLEIAGITGARVYDDPSGAASDIWNSYHYDPQTGWSWDLSMPSP